jgi:hypothetical protein
MMPAYPAARAAAGPIREHFARHGTTNGHAPATHDIEAIIEAAFWASLRREEGFLPKISLAFVAPEVVKWPLRFERPLPLAAQALVRLSPAVERPGIHLGVWRDENGLCVWGAIRKLPPYCLVIEVVAPGLLVVKHSRGGEEKFVNVAVLQGDEVKIIDEQSAQLPGCPDLLTSLLGFDTQHASTDSLSVLIHLAVSMRAHGRGGSLLVVPAGSEAWRESVLHPVLYQLVPPFSALREVMQRRSSEAAPDRGWMDALRRAVDGVAGLTAVDGATVMTDAYEVLAFGVKITRRQGSPQVTDVVLTEPIQGAQPDVIEPGQLGGTRHLSAAQFVRDQRDALALVASQDGRFTVFAWSECENKVRAHRIEALLL